MHTRYRHIKEIFKKRARIFPVLGLLGPRQVGKSTFLKEEWAISHKAEYLTLDKKSIRERARKAPEHFLQIESSNSKVKLIIDEAQKVPDLFDAVKVLVDENRIRGLFTLSGSSEFSSKSYIRESLTGRIGISRLFPLTVREIRADKYISSLINCINGKFSTFSVNVNSDIENWLIRGGMPVFCKLSDKAERFIMIEEWLETLCLRDIHHLRGAKYDSELAKDILYALAKLNYSTASNVGKELRVDTRRIKTHLEGLKALFVVNEVKSHRTGIGPSCYFLFDSGVASFLGAARKQCLKIWFLNECLAQFEYAGNARPAITYYRSSKHSEIDFVINDRNVESGVLLIDEESFGPYIKRTYEGFLKKLPKSQVLVIAPISSVVKEQSRVTFVPWQQVV